MKEFVIGDLHFYNDDIRRFENRPWSTVKEMNEALISNWNSVVSVNDKVFVVGDFIEINRCSEPEAINILNQLNGKIILLAGNHDKPYLDFYRKHGVTVIEFPIVYHDFWILSHEPMYVNMNSPYANIFAHVHGNPMYKTVSERSYCVSAERIGYIPILLQEAMNAVLLLTKKGDNLC